MQGKNALQLCSLIPMSGFSQKPRLYGITIHKGTYDLLKINSYEQSKILQRIINLKISINYNVKSTAYFKCLAVIPS